MNPLSRDNADQQEHPEDCAGAVDGHARCDTRWLLVIPKCRRPWSDPQKHMERMVDVTVPSNLHRSWRRKSPYFDREVGQDFEASASVTSGTFQTSKTRKFVADDVPTQRSSFSPHEHACEREDTSVVQKRFDFPENSVGHFAEVVENRVSCAMAPAAWKTVSAPQRKHSSSTSG